MLVRRLLPVLVAAGLAPTAALAQPAPAGAPAPTDATSTTPPAEEPPPSDMEGTSEDPSNPGQATTNTPVAVVKVAPKRPTGYPVQEALRPLNLPAQMSEVAIDPHVQIDPGMGTQSLRARYGVTNKVQIGLTYVLGALYNENDVDPMGEDKQSLHSGKAIGLDVQVLLKDWIAIRVGVPVYLKPVAASLALGAPLKFVFGDKFAVGGLDDLLNIKLEKFAPSFYQEAFNALGDVRDRTNAIQSRGQFRVSAYGIYQHRPKLAVIGRTGFLLEDFQSNKANGGGLFYFLRAGVDYTPKKYLDVGFSLGFDDLSALGTFGPAGYLAFRI